MHVAESHVDIDGASLYCRDVGNGPAVVVIHGGPDFDHTYLLPDLDRLADGYRLIYYDQRGRGQSQGKLRLEHINIERYVEDLDRIRESFGLDRMTVLGHSWGGFVAMHYAMRHPERLAAMILLNTASATSDDIEAMGMERQRRWQPRRKEMDAISDSDAFAAGDPDAVESYYRLDFGTTIAAEFLPRLKLRWTRADILRGRAIEEKLAEGLYWKAGYSIIAELRDVDVPTLVIHGDDDYVQRDSSSHIADAIPGARLVNIPNSGHFSYVDAPRAVRRAIDEFAAVAG
jgi:proline iminopeptidase